MQVPLTAYADDCTFTGELALPATRLADFLTSTTEFNVGNVAFRALDDGRVIEAESAAILREDLCVVLAGEPRGSPELRVWTRQYPVLARVGPYVVRGYLHAPPTIDPLKMRTRRAILALTQGKLAYTEAGTVIEVEAEAILLNSAKVEALEAVTIEDIDGDSIGGLEFPAATGTPDPEVQAEDSGG
jgi:hypothetical protein